MSMDSKAIMGYVQHYQRNIERAQDNEQKLLYCIGKLYKLPIKMEHLQETGIGKTVNALRKFEGEVSVAAKALVTKWKAMVSSQDEDKAAIKEEDIATTTTTTQPNEIINTHSSSVDRKHKDKVKNSTNHEVASTSKSNNHHHRSSKERHHRQKTENKECPSNEATNGKHERSHESHKKDREDTENRKKKSKSHHKSHTRESSKSLKNETDQEHGAVKSEKSKSSEDHQHKSSSSSTKRAHEARENNVKEASSSKKKIKLDPAAQVDETQAVADDGIDSSMGANFADVLGMLNMPGSSRKSKKAAGSSNTPICSYLNSSKNDETPSTSHKSSKSSSSNVEKKVKIPELLQTGGNLEPLDPNIALELPTISNNYRPMPLNQTVMDCVFNTSSSSNTKSATAARTLTDAEAYQHGISSKTMRTKIYSGSRTGTVHQVPSLFDLCIRMLQKNIDCLEYTGGVPYDVLKNVLDRATPEQLYMFEEYNPYIMEDSDILWKAHIQRKYRTAKRQEMESWREMFLRCQEDEERRLNFLAEAIKLKEKKDAEPIRKTQLAFVDSLVKPPRNVQRKQEQYGTRGKLIATPAARVVALSNVTPNAAKPGDVRLRVAASTSRDPAQVFSAPSRAKKAPLMAKTLQFMRGRHKR